MIASLCRDSTLASPTPEKRHWEFPCLEIPEAPLQHGGAPWDLLCQEISEVPTRNGGGLLVAALRGGPQQILCAKSRPTSVQTYWKGCGGP